MHDSRVSVDKGTKKKEDRIMNNAKGSINKDLDDKKEDKRKGKKGYYKTRK